MMTLRQNFIASLGVLAFALGVGVANQAAAQTVSLQPVAEQLSSALTVLVGAFVTFLVGQISLWVHKKTKIDTLKIEEIARAYLLDATKRAISWGMSQLEAKDLLDIDVKSKVVALAVQYLVDRVPGTLKQLGISEDKIAGFVEARIGPFDLGAPVTVAGIGVVANSVTTAGVDPTKAKPGTKG